MKNRFLKLLTPLLLMTFLFSAGVALAADAPKGDTVQLQLKPFLSSVDAKGYSEVAKSNNPGLAVGFLYKIAMTIVGLVAFGSLVYAGILRTWGAVGSPARIKEADERIKDTLWGILLLAGAAVIFNTINPQINNVGAIGETINQIMPKTKAPTGNVNVLDFYSSAMEGSLDSEGRISGGRTFPVAGLTSNNSNAVTVQGKNGGHILSQDAANNYYSLNNQVKDICAQSGFNCRLEVTETVDNTVKHTSSCHSYGNSLSGACADLAIRGCETSACYNAVFKGIVGSRYITSCRNEYEAPTKNTTAGSLHCNF